MLSRSPVCLEGMIFLLIKLFSLLRSKDIVFLVDLLFCSDRSGETFKICNTLPINDVASSGSSFSSLIVRASCSGGALVNLLLKPRYLTEDTLFFVESEPAAVFFTDSPNIFEVLCCNSLIFLTLSSWDPLPA